MIRANFRIPVKTWEATIGELPDDYPETKSDAAFSSAPNEYLIDGDELLAGIYAVITDELDLPDSQKPDYDEIVDAIPESFTFGVRDLLPTTADNWYPGKRCPNCGCDTVSFYFIDRHVMYSDNDEHKYLSHPEDPINRVVKTECNDCMATLRTTPIGCMTW